MIALCLMTAFSLQAQYSENDLLSEANALFNQEAYAEAMPLYAQLLSLHSTNPEYNYKYGATALFGDADKKEEAIKFLEYASTKNGIEPACWYFLARAYHLNYRFADAIDAYKKYKELGSKKKVANRNVDRLIQDCLNGQNLLTNIKEITVLTKKKSPASSFFRIYDLSDIGGKILVTPDILLSAYDTKHNHKSLILFKGTGTTVYFSSYGKDGKNGLDIYRADVLPNGKFSTPQPLGARINTPFDEDYPFLHPDNKTFYFSSKGHSSMGGYDIFKSTYNQMAGTFAPPTNLDFAINTPDDDLFYVTDSAKKMANFASARQSEQGQLEVYKVLVTNVPAEITLVKGSFSNAIDPGLKLAKITVVEASSNSEIDVQYTDPNTGDYVLSFPRSGRFKFSVEVQGSEQVHTGIVTIPKSSGVSAYLQEMKLVQRAGVDKLIINNLFDKKYEGDITALAQKLLLQRAALNVNFNKTEPPAVPDTAGVAEPEIALAYTEAGFGAGMSNEKVLEISKLRTVRIQNQAKHIADLAGEVSKEYTELLIHANAKATEAAELIELANNNTDGARSSLMFRAAIEKMKAEKALEAAQNSQALIEYLALRESEAQSEYQSAKMQSDSLALALTGNDYSTVLNALKREREIQKSIDKAAVKNDPVKEIRSLSLQAKADAKKYMDRAVALRKRTDNLQAELLVKTRRLETAKRKDKERIATEISNLNTEIDGTERRTDSAFQQANRMMEAATSKSQQYELLASLDEESTSDKTDKSQKSDTVEVSNLAFNKTADQISNLRIDPSLIVAYMHANPDAPMDFDDEKTTLFFRKQYAAADKNTLAESNTPQQGGDTDHAGIEIAGIATEGTDTGGDQSQNHSTLESSKPDSSGQKADGEENEKEQLIPVESTGTETGANALTLDTTKTPALADLSNDSGVARMPTTNSNESQSTINTTENQLDDSAPSQTSIQKREADKKERTENQVSTPADALAGTTKTGKNDLNTTVPIETAEIIKAEEANIKAADDWITIINESIADLEKEARLEGTLNDRETQDQLSQYKGLVEAKEKEKAESEARISELQKKEKDSDPNAEFVVQRAEADIDTLSASLISRLEMKSNESATDKKTIRDIGKIDAAYLAELQEIELSGLSAPEIASKRIALNEAFIVKTEEQIQNPPKEGLSVERLLELRRMKALEIKIDRQVRIGEERYAPLTPEGRAHYELLADNEGSERAKNNPETDLSLLSPEISEDLGKPFTSEMVMPGYDKRLQMIEKETSDSLKLANRIELNTKYLTDLKSDIEMYKLALDNTEATSVENPLASRYSILLSERSELFSKLASDQEELRKIQNQVQVVPQELAEHSEIGNTKSGNDAQESNMLEANRADFDDAEGLILKKRDRVQHFDSLYMASVAAIENQNMSESKELTALSGLNSEIAVKIDSTIQTLVIQLDNPKLSINRDSLQLEIQHLDAIAADKRQEADRLSSAAELLALNTVAPPDEQGIKDGNNLTAKAAADTTTERNVVADASRVDAIIGTAEKAIERPHYTQLMYKSLNANITFNKINTKLDSSTQQRKEAVRLIAEIEAATDEGEKIRLAEQLDIINTALQERDKAIQAAIENSNAAEIAYYQTDNNAIISQIEALPTETTKGIAIDGFSAKSSQLSMEFAQNEAALQKGRISPSEKIQRDLELILRLDSLNGNLDEVRDEIIPDMRVAEAKDATEINRNPEDRAPLYNMDQLEMASNYEPKPGMTYINTVYADYNSRLDSAERFKHISVEPKLALEADFLSMSTPQRNADLINAATAIDAHGLALLEAEPLKIQYVVASIKADSLKKFELIKAEYANTMAHKGRENLAELNRLKSVLLHEENTDKRDQIQSRINRLEADVNTNFEKATIAAYQAEQLRNNRIVQERILTGAAAKLERNDLAELKAVLKHKTYTIIPSDLASTEKHEVPPQPSSDLAKAASNGITKGRNTKGTSQTLSYAAHQANSPDEQALLESNGLNWLKAVEIVAEKEDFSNIETSLFLDTEKPIYSLLKPIPLNPVLPDGLIFQVQVGAYRNTIPQDLFGEFAPIMGEKLTDGITRYRAGIFSKYNEAADARDTIRVRGYSDAFVVAFFDGERLTGAQVRDILRQAAAKDELDNPVLAANNRANGVTAINEPDGSLKSNTTNKIDYYSDTTAAKAVQVEVTAGLFFTVQVGVYSKPVKLDKLYNLIELNSELTSSGYIRYTSGRYASVGAASGRKAQVIEKGVSDAFITAYYNGKRIALSKAQELLKKEGRGILSEKLTPVSNSTIQTTIESPERKDKKQKLIGKPKPENEISDNSKYVIILGSYAGDIPQNIANVFLARPDLKVRRVTAPNGVSIYASPEFDSLQEAKDFLKLSREAGVNSAVMGKLVDGKITEVTAE